MKKTTQFIQKNMFFIGIVIIGVGYIITGISSIVTTKQSIDEIVATGGITTILGWLISTMFGQQAIIDGYEDEDLISAFNELSKTAEELEPNVNKLDIFCEKDNKNEMIRKRKRILGRVGISYKDFLAGNYSFYTNKKRKKRAIKKARKIGYGYLTSDWLLADIDEQDEKDCKKPMSISKYTWSKNIKGFISKAITGTISAYYILEPFVKMNWNTIAWRLFFFALWLIFGYVRYVVDFNFITKIYRKTITKKRKCLLKFKASLLETPEWYVIGKEKDNLLTEGNEKEGREPHAEIL